MRGKVAVNPLSADPTSWSNTLKQFVSKLQTNCLNVVDHFVGLSLKGLIRFLILFHTFGPIFTVKVLLDVFQVELLLGRCFC